MKRLGIRIFGFEELGLKRFESLQRARGVVVSHPLSMREAMGSIPSVSILLWGSTEETIEIAERGFDPRTFGL